MIRLLREAGINPQSYSGRFMYGKRCVAFVTSNIAASTAMLMSSVILQSREDLDFIQEAFQSMKQDNMAFDWILYWPDLEWPNEIPDL